MFWSGLSIRRFLQILGTIELVRIIWFVGRKYWFRRRGPELPQVDHVPNEQERFLVALRKLYNDVLRVKRGLRKLLTNRHHDEQEIEYEEYENRRRIKELEEQVEENQRTLTAEVELMCDSNDRELSGLLDAVLLRYEEENAQYVQGLEVVRKEFLMLKTMARNYRAECQQFQWDSVGIAQDEFERIQEEFEEKFLEFKTRIDGFCKEAAFSNHKSDKGSRDAFLLITDKTYQKLENSMILIEDNCRTSFAEFEVSAALHMVNELTKMSYQSESIPIHENIDNVVVILWRIPGFQEKLICLWEESRPITCDELFTIESGLKVKPALKRGIPPEQFIDISLDFTEDLNEDGKPDHSPFFHYRTFILLDQTTNSIRDDIKLYDRPPFTETEMLQPFFTESKICSVDEFKDEGKYVKNDEVLIKIVLEPLAYVVSHLAAHGGVLLWKIDNYSVKVRDELAGRKKWLISAPFRTSEMGYHAQVELLFNGARDDNDNVYISVRVRFILGVSDHMLKLPLSGACRHILMDQSDSGHRRNISVLEQYGYEGIERKHSKYQQGEERIVTTILMDRCFLRSKADNVPYLKDDSILIKSIVDVH